MTRTQLQYDCVSRYVLVWRSACVGSVITRSRGAVQLLVLSACESFATGGTLTDAGLPPTTTTSPSPYALLGTGNGDPWGVAWERFLAAITPSTLASGPGRTLPKVVSPFRLYSVYVARLAHVSSVCRLTPNEERAVQAVCATLVARNNAYANHANWANIEARSAWLAAESSRSKIRLSLRHTPSSPLGHGLACAAPLIEEARRVAGGAQPPTAVEDRKKREEFHAIPAPPPTCSLLADAYSIEAASDGLPATELASVIRVSLGDDLKRKLAECRSYRISIVADDAALLLGQLTREVPPLSILERVARAVPLALTGVDAARTLGVLLARDWLQRATSEDVGQPARLSSRPVLGVVAAVTWAVSVRLAAKWATPQVGGAVPMLPPVFDAVSAGRYGARVLWSDGVARCFGPFVRTEFALGSKRLRELHDLKLRLQTAERVAESSAAEAYHRALLQALERFGAQALSAISARHGVAPRDESTEVAPALPCAADSVNLTVLLLEPSRSRERAHARDTACDARTLVGVSNEDAAVLRWPLKEVVVVPTAVDEAFRLGAGTAPVAAAAAIPRAFAGQPHRVLSDALLSHTASLTEAGRGLSERVQRAASAISDGAGDVPASTPSPLSAVALIAAVDAAHASALGHRTNVNLELMMSGPLERLSILESLLYGVRRNASDAAERCRAQVVVPPPELLRRPADERATNAPRAAMSLLQVVAITDRADMMRALARTLRSAACVPRVAACVSCLAS
jgi:hypothetical protein